VLRQMTIGAAVPTSAQVFVDDSGRRRRWVRLAGVGVTAVCAGYIGIIVVGLSQTGVGPLEAVPEGGNGAIAGFQNSAGTVPGLLANAGSPRAVSQGGHAAVPAHRVVAPAAAKTTTARTTAARTTTAPTATARTATSTAMTSKVVAAPAAGSASSSSKDGSGSSGAKGSTGSSGSGSKSGSSKGSSKATDSTGSGSGSGGT
jgi:hypothetical protein